MLNLHRVFLLRELARLGTMTEVADEQIMSPSSVSQQIAQLERETKVSLVEKAGRGVVLTDAGRRLVRRSEELLALSETAEAELDAARSEVGGVLSVASFQTPLISLAPLAVSVLEQRHPEMRVEISQREVDDAFDGLLARRFDVILGEDYPGGERPGRRGTDREDLLRDPLLLVLPDHGPWSSPRTLADLADAPWALDFGNTRTGRWERGYLRAAGIEPWVRFDTTDPLLQAHLVRSGHALAFLPGLIAAENLAGTRPLRLPGEPHRSLYTAARTGARDRPALRAFRAALLAAADELTSIDGLEQLDG